MATRRIGSMCGIVLAALAPALAVVAGACSGVNLADIAPQAPKFELKTLPTNPTRAIRTFPPPTLIRSDGACLGAVDESGFAPGSGVALEMSECDVVQRAGAPDNIDIGSNPRGERAVVLTYLRGERPGIYRFVSGRLVTIERAPGAPEEPKPAKKTKGRAKT